MGHQKADRPRTETAFGAALAGRREGHQRNCRKEKVLKTMTSDIGLIRQLLEATGCRGSGTSATERRLAALLILSSVLMSACGYDGLAPALKSIGLSKDVPGPIQVDIVLDPSDGSPGANEASLKSALNVVLPIAGERFGSDVRLWAMAASAGETRILEELRSERPKRLTTAARRAQVERFISLAEAAFLKSTAPLLSDPHRDRSRSPILESIAKVAAYSAVPENVRRFLIVISDLREVSELGGDWECNRLPQPEQFLKRLHSAQILTPGSLSEAHVILTYASGVFDEVPRQRCPFVFGHGVQIRRLWEAVLKAAGRQSVRFKGGAITRDDLAVPERREARNQ
ncbi:MAG: hypothetical protein HY645_13540 [Acidobacteria bacterium]|nr:hypothetical protein [Acidobacteriota bacterium]